MGKIIKCKYRVEYIDNDWKSCNDRGWTGSSAPVRGCKTMVWKGRATEARLKDWRDGMNKSFRADGCNAHVSKFAGILVHIGSCQVVEQDSDRVVCRFIAPMFEVV